MAARSSHELTPSGNFTRTPSWIGLPRDIVTPLAGLSSRSYRSRKSDACRASISGLAASMRATVFSNSS